MRTVQCGDPELLSALARLGGEKWIASNYLDDDITRLVARTGNRQDAELIALLYTDSYKLTELVDQQRLEIARLRRSL
jgi:hypothetical protein